MEPFMIYAPVKDDIQGGESVKDLKPNYFCMPNILVFRAIDFELKEQGIEVFDENFQTLDCTKIICGEDVNGDKFGGMFVGGVLEVDCEKDKGFVWVEVITAEKDKGHTTFTTHYAKLPEHMWFRLFPVQYECMGNFMSHYRINGNY
jgi:hypothetical protein